MNNAANTKKNLQITFNGIKSDVFGPEKLEWCKEQARKMRDEFGWKVSLKRVSKPTMEEDRAEEEAKHTQREADYKARILAQVDHEDDDGSAREIAMENGWL